MDYAIYFVLVFLVALTGLGIWHSRKIKTGEDFALAGRKLGVTVMVGTLVATWIGTGSLFGNTEKTCIQGWYMFFLPISGALGIIVLAWLAPRVRSLPAKTVPQILAVRFGRAAQIIGALALISAYLIIVSYQFRAGATVARYLLNKTETQQTSSIAIDQNPISIDDAVTAAVVDDDNNNNNNKTKQPDVVTTTKKDINADVTAANEKSWSPWPIAFALFVILYTVLAGMVSVAWTDLINGIMMTIGLLAALLWVYLHWDPATQPMIPIRDTDVNVHSWTAIKWIGYMLPAFLLIMGDANLHQRFMSTKTPATARKAAIGMFFGVLLLELTVIALAYIGWAMLETKPSNPAYTIIDMAFNPNILPAAIGIMLVAAAAAVIITTADSFLLASATSAASDLAGKDLTSPTHQRVLVVVMGLLALGLAYTSDKFFDVALFAYTLYGVTLTPAILCALLKPDIPGKAIVSGMIAGLLIATLWKVMLSIAWSINLLDKLYSGLSSQLGQWEPVLPALAANLIIVIIVAAYLKNKTPDYNS